MPRRQAASRFGTETAARLSEHPADVEDAEDLIEVGDWPLVDFFGVFTAPVA